jgi:penicillin-binding protein 2
VIITEKEHSYRRRGILCLIIALIVFGVYIARLFDWQIIEGEKYKEISKNSASYSLTSNSTRGEILTSDGKPLATNRTIYNIALKKSYIDENNLNSTIIKVLDILKTRNEEWVDELPITYKDGNYSFTEDDDTQEKIEFLQSDSMLDTSVYTMPEEYINDLVKRYDCKNIKDKEQQINLISVRFNMERENFSSVNDYIIAEDVSNDMMQIISENSNNLKGVEITTTVERQYKNGTLAPHIVGTIGKISQEEYEEHEDDGYGYNDLIGKFGIERAFEDTLRGTAGTEYIERNANGTIIKTVQSENAEPGNTVWLTLDSELQKTANEALEYNVNKSHDEEAKDCEAGAVVMLDVSDFSVLAASTYPSYDISKYSNYKYYSKLANDETSPLYSRAFDGAFAPGSVFKPCVALAGLEEGKIDSKTYITCTQNYDYYPSDVVKCMGYHGAINLNTALEVSCNYYFAELGRRLGINTIYSYAEKFGLGLPTGVEIDENTGFLAGRDSTQWTAGNTVQASIGQSDNAFTPAQLASYVATIANNGVRLKTHLVKKITSYDRTDTIEENSASNAQVLSTLEVDSKNLKTVQKGMWSVCNEENGTAYSTFGDYGVTVAAKTGTAENSGTDHTVFICYAPYEKPQVAIAVVIEHGAYTKYSSQVAKALLDKYFFDKDYNPD